MEDAKNLRTSLILQQAVHWKRIQEGESLKVKREALTRSKMKRNREALVVVDTARQTPHPVPNCASLSCKTLFHVQILTN